MQVTQLNLREITVKEQDVLSIFDKVLPKQLQQGDTFTGKVNVYVDPKPESDMFYYAQANYENGELKNFEINTQVANDRELIYQVLKQEKVNKIRRQEIDFSSDKRKGFWLPYPFQFFSFNHISGDKFEFTYIESDHIKAAPKALVFEKFDFNEKMGLMGERRYIVNTSDYVIFQREPLPGEKFEHKDYLNIEEKKVWMDRLKSVKVSSTPIPSDN